MLLGGEKVLSSFWGRWRNPCWVLNRHLFSFTGVFRSKSAVKGENGVTQVIQRDLAELLKGL